MSLLDDVSIVVTPNGYKAGELYAVIPVPTEGTELLTNYDFASDLTGWTGYGTASATGGIATIGASSCCLRRTLEKVKKCTCILSNMHIYIYIYLYT